MKIEWIPFGNLLSVMIKRVQVLGLAIVRNILELHEMSYGVHNLEDGVEFYFRWKNK